MQFTVPTLNEEEVLTKLIWGDFLHLPTPVKLSMATSAFKINTPGVGDPNIQVVAGEVVARDDDNVKLWRLTGAEALRLYAPRSLNCDGCGRITMMGQNYCSNCGVRLVG